MEALRAWPLRDLLLAYVERLKQEARRCHEHELLVWALLAPHQKNPGKAPALPEILKG